MKRGELPRYLLIVALIVSIISFASFSAIGQESAPSQDYSPEESPADENSEAGNSQENQEISPSGSGENSNDESQEQIPSETPDEVNEASIAQITEEENFPEISEQPLPADLPNSDAIYADIEEAEQLVQKTQDVTTPSDVSENKYEYLELNITVSDELSNPSEAELEEPFPLYRDGKKEFEIQSLDNAIPQITKEETTTENSDLWKKKVKVYSEEHYENPVKVYSDILETQEENIKVLWLEEDKQVSFEKIDSNNNTLIDRVAWTVPHLSEQNFEITIDFILILDIEPSESNLSIQTISAPSGTVSNSSVSFSFNVSSSDNSSVQCNFSLSNTQATIINQEISSPFSLNQNLSNGNYTWSFICHQQNNTDSVEGAFTILIPQVTPQNFTNVSFTSNRLTLNQFENVIFTVTFNASTNSQVYYIIDYGDSSNYQRPVVSAQYFSESQTHNYTTSGSRTAQLRFYVNNALFSTQNIALSVSQVNFSDTENPSITLQYPENDATFEDEEIIFSYRATDNVKVSNCTFLLNYYNQTNTGKEVYKNTKTDIVHGADVNISLVDFDEGLYDWEVKCYDNSTNYASRYRDFEIDFDSSDEQTLEITKLSTTNEFESEVGQIDILLDSINDFLVKEETFTKPEREAVEDLGITEDLKFYKKRLLQIKQDLEHNVNYIRGENKREERTEEIIAELEEIAEKIPTSLEVIESSEFHKNSLDTSMSDVVNAFIEKNSLVVEKNALREMVESNEEAQNILSVTASIKQVRVEYASEEKEITLVTKKLSLSGEEFDSFIEVIPKEVTSDASNVVFITEASVLKSDPIFEIKKDSVKSDRIVYHIDKFVTLNLLEDTDTFVFLEKIPATKSGLITGFVTGVTGSASGMGFYVGWLVFGVFAIVLFFFGLNKVRVIAWGKNTDFSSVVQITKEAEKYLRGNEVELARDLYHQAKSIYPATPEKSRGYLFKKIKKVQLGIDKKDIANLMREFLSAAKADDRAYALSLYEDIKSIYPRIPKKYKEKVYTRILPYVRKFKGNI